jgi:hypothetical protein
MNFCYPSASSLARIVACALGVFALAPGVVHSQYYGADWDYFDPGFGPGIAPGYDLPSFPAPSYDFGIPGFSSEGSPTFVSIDNNPLFGMGLYPSGVESDVAEWNGILSSRGGYTENRYRSKVKDKVKPKLRRKK